MKRTECSSYNKYLKHSSLVQHTAFHPRERMLAKISITWKLFLKLLGPEILLSSLKSSHSFSHSPSHLGLMHRHEHLLRKTTKNFKTATTVGLLFIYYFKYCLLKCDSTNRLKNVKAISGLSFSYLKQLIFNKYLCISSHNFNIHAGKNRVLQKSQIHFILHFQPLDF